MRISEDRYFRDLRPLLLAARMLKLEARTRTICTWTGMSRDRIRKLAGSSLPSDRQKARVRHRGRSPRQTAYFFRSPRIYAHANLLACYFAMVELIPRGPDVIPAKACKNAGSGTTVPFDPKNSGTAHPVQLPLFDGMDGTGPQRLNDSATDTRPTNAAGENAKSTAVTVASLETEGTISIRDTPESDDDSQ